MSLTAIIPVLVKVSILASVFALGLNATWEDVNYLWHRPAQLSRSLLAMYFVTPLIALLLVLTIPASEGVKLVVLLMTISAGAPILPKKLLHLGANPLYVYSLAVTAAITAIVTLPISLAILGSYFHRDVSVSMGQVASVITMIFLAPLLAGMAVRYFWPHFADRIGGPLSGIAFAVLMGIALLILINTFSKIVAEGLLAFILIIATTFAALATGHFMGGPHPNDRTTLALACGTRFPTLVMLIASLNFPHALPMPIVVTYLLVSHLAALPYVQWRKALQKTTNVKIDGTSAAQRTIGRHA